MRKIVEVIQTIYFKTMDISMWWAPFMLSFFMTEGLPQQSMALCHWLYGCELKGVRRQGGHGWKHLDAIGQWMDYHLFVGDIGCPCSGWSCHHWLVGATNRRGGRSPEMGLVLEFHLQPVGAASKKWNGYHRAFQPCIASQKQPQWQE